MISRLFRRWVRVAQAGRPDMTPVGGLAVSDVRQAVGRWVQLEVGAPNRYTAGGIEVGILREADDEFLYIERPDGESVCLPVDQAWNLRLIEGPKSAPDRPRAPSTPERPNA